MIEKLLGSMEKLKGLRLVFQMQNPLRSKTLAAYKPFVLSTRSAATLSFGTA